MSANRAILRDEIRSRMPRLFLALALLALVGCSSTEKGSNAPNGAGGSGGDTSGPVGSGGQGTATPDASAPGAGGNRVADGGTPGSGGAAGAGNARDASAPTTTPATWINPAGSVASGSNPFGIVGYWYAFGDGVTSTATGNPYRDGKYCIRGTALGKVDAGSHWGAGLGLDLSYSGGQKSAYSYQGKITGFRVRLDGTAPAGARFHFVTNPANSASPFVEATLNQSVVYRIADARVPLDWNAPNAGERVGSILYSIQVQVIGDAVAGPIDVCISEFEPVYDPSGGAGPTTVGGAYINSDGFITATSNPFGIAGQVYVISDGTSTTQSGNPYMAGKYCVAGTFSAANAWAGIAFDLNRMPGQSRAPYAYRGKIGGFRLALSGDSPGEVHINFVTSEPAQSIEPFLVARLDTTQIFPIAWAQVPATWAVPNAGASVGDSLYTLQVSVDGKKPGPFNVCVEDLVPLPENQLTRAAMPAAAGYTGARTLDQSILSAEYTAWKTDHFVDCNDGSACVPRSQGDCISEGIGYGMLLTVANNDRASFDKLWAYFQRHKDANGVMTWQTNRCGAGIASTSATDGDLDAAMGLIQAGCKWGGTYRSDGAALINALRASAVTTCGGQTILKPGDTFGGCDRTNPSYFAPAYYKVFEAVTGDATWRNLTNDSYTLLASVQAKMNGLVPNWTNSTGTIPAGDDGTYGFDASRTPWRIATDYVWNGEPRAVTFLNGVSRYVDANGGIPRLFTPNSAFRGGLAMSGLPQDSAKAQGYTDAWLTTVSEVDDNDYYPATLRLIYMLLLAQVFPSGC